MCWLETSIPADEPSGTIAGYWLMSKASMVLLAGSGFYGWWRSRRQDQAGHIKTLLPGIDPSRRTEAGTSMASDRAIFVHRKRDRAMIARMDRREPVRDSSDRRQPRACCGVGLRYNEKADVPAGRSTVGVRPVL